MSSILNFCRAAARSPRFFPARSLSFLSPEEPAPLDTNPSPTSELSGYFMRESAGGTAPESSANTTSPDRRAQTYTSEERSNVRGLERKHWLKPKDFTRKAREAVRRYPKPQLLGPDAKESRRLDLFYNLNIDPLAECENSTLLSNFVTEMGKIRPRSQTNLTWRNQRRLGKAIRRAKMMGIIPVLSRRPLKATGLM